MPVIVRPDPPPPTNVEIATRVFGSELLVALIQHYRLSPGPQIDAATALDIPTQLASTSTRTLIQAGVVVGNPPGAGRRPGRYIVDDRRVRDLLAALTDYCLGDEQVDKPRRP